MRTCLFLALALAVAPSIASAQCFDLAEVNAETAEGQLLQHIGQESDEAAKLQLLENFAAQHPTHEAAGWVYEQLQAAYMKSNSHDKALEIAEKILKLAPGCAEAAHQALKAAEAKKDPDLVLAWSGRTSEIALQVANAPKPEDEDEVETWKNRADWARQVNIYTEYSLYAMSLQTTDPQKKIALVEALEKRNASSEYLPKAYPQLFLAYRQAGDNEKAIALAEKVLATDQSDVDMLVVVASDYLAKKKEPDKVHAYTAKAVELAAAQPVPEGVAEDAWKKRREGLMGAAHFISGSLYYTQSRWAQADAQLRRALPFLDNQEMKAEALYYLGFANYKLEKGQEAANYFRQCAAIKSRFQAAAARDLRGVRSQFTGIK